MTAYCPTCRSEHEVEANPPYAVVHTLDGRHLHPLTREEV
jgi:acetone carboxylase gamma subunit